MNNPFETLWNVPRAPEPPPRGRWDWLFVAALVVIALVEGFAREDVYWRPLAIVLALAIAFLQLLRRSDPLLAAGLAFGTSAVVQVVALALDVRWEGLFTNVHILVLPYALLRWGSGREALIGIPFIAVSFFVSALTDFESVGDLIGGALFLMFPAVLGVTFRLQDAGRRRERDQVRLRERELLARELHDTVAHHVSAIAIQAQAGRALATSRPEAAGEVLEVIEEAASRTLTEMRTIVGALRDGDSAELAPQPGVFDIERLAGPSGSGPSGTGPAVTVTLGGDLEDLRPAVGAALYRLAQEAVTNAVRHALGASRIEVEVTGEADLVRLTVSDDGGAGAFAVGGSGGYGLVGMTERAKLLGGTLTAGPGLKGGWRVTAVLPREAVSP